MRTFDPLPIHFAIEADHRVHAATRTTRRLPHPILVIVAPRDDSRRWELRQAVVAGGQLAAVKSIAMPRRFAGPSHALDAWTMPPPGGVGLNEMAGGRRLRGRALPAMLAPGRPNVAHQTAWPHEETTVAFRARESRQPQGTSRPGRNPCQYQHYCHPSVAKPLENGDGASHDWQEQQESSPEEKLAAAVSLPG